MKINEIGENFGKIGRLLALAGLAATLSTMSASGAAYDLINNQEAVVPGDFGGTAIFRNYWEQPTGTGVFDPFLSLDANGKTSTSNNYIESAYNSDGKGAQHPNLYLDQHRSEWNTLLRISDLATLKINNVDYFGFILDANENGNMKSLISIDNIRIYTSKTDNTANVADNINNLDLLGTKRWAMNDPLSGSSDGFNVEKWVELDADQNNIGKNSNGGSGQADMIVYIPTSAFGDSLGTDDYIWFYNLNGVHYNEEQKATNDFSATTGFEEWKAVVGPQSRVPDNGNTLALLGSALTILGLLASRRTLLHKA